MKVIQKKRFNPTIAQSSCQEKPPLNYSQASEQIQCCYINSTTQFQIVRVANVSNNFLERMVMPQTRLVFEADRNDHLEIHTGSPISSILSDKIPCHRLAYQEDHNR
ncbi:protein of unknown function DUF1830 [Leptolyngbya sp. PCC 7375]|nr:protein of unknown function DUF1830 [Leptolyngbya sp. PCC 7375]